MSSASSKAPAASSRKVLAASLFAGALVGVVVSQRFKPEPETVDHPAELVAPSLIDWKR